MRVHPMMPQQKQMMQLLDYLNLREAFETSGVFDENRPETVNASPEKIAERQPEQRAPQQAVIRLQLVLHRLDTNLTGVPLPQIPV